MVSARALLEVNETTNRRASFGPDETVRSIQLYATNPDVVGAAVRKLVEEDGVDHVDLNVGCPSPKVTRAAAARRCRRTRCCSATSCARRCARRAPSR
jgi:tRNA-dihydrouridine synthase